MALLSSCLNKISKALVILLFIQVEVLSNSYPLLWNVPTENPYFVGREEILDTILGIFKAAPLKRVVITGSQGFGKSQIAKRFVYQNFAHYDIVWWFRANQYLKPQFEKFALELAPYLGLNIDLPFNQLAPEQLIRMVKEGIRRKSLKCLIIFDDAPTYPEIEQYIPFSHENNMMWLQ